MKINKKSLIIFAVSSISVFLMNILPHFGVRFNPLISPSPVKADSFDSIKPKLEQKQDNFQIKKEGSLIKKAEASGEYDGARSYAVINFDSGELLYQKDFSQKLPIASLTKLMSSVVALDLVSPGDKFTVSSKAANIEPTRMGLIEGQSWSLEELLNGALMTSANDAVETIAEGIDQRYGSGTFVRAMNEKARVLGLSSSSFQNPQGFDGDYSSSEDLVKLTHYALTNYPLIKGIVAKDYQLFPESNTHKRADLYNWNGLLGVYPGVEGVKIGNTDEAGYTDIVLSEREGKQVLVVMLGASGVLERDMYSSELLDLGFSKLGLGQINLTQAQLKQKYSTWKYWQ